MNAAGKLKMDRDEMTVVTFVSVGDVRPRDLRTATEHCNQISEPTGSDFEERSHRPTTECLGLFCVLLLLCVLLLMTTVMLCVKFTKEETPFQTERQRNHLLSENKNLTEEREQLKRDIAELTNRLSEQDLCPHNSKWITHSLSSYYVSSEWKNWSESRRYCRERGADLVIINNTEEQNFITHITSGNIVWIGLTDGDEEGFWKWVDGTNMTSGFWGPGEPNSKMSNEDCAVSLFDWADYPCNYTFVWICERAFEV